MMRRWLAHEGALTALACFLIVLLAMPIKWLGIGWALAVGAVLLAFVIGWACARKAWRKLGYVPKL